ncbi:hypothetical protein BDN72DRAFT_579880 [Pluteus cervinus]|uniref:Uncharacterized protein n=1 Tax=Pluteus cervinus TaxID=181527 RepID=A0ACD3AWI5_9AGAR|nr:hypothetical protein BDN72DRAFT_579880 [Pluteus cervinus]
MCTYHPATSCCGSDFGGFWVFLSSNLSRIFIMNLAVCPFNLCFFGVAMIKHMIEGWNLKIPTFSPGLRATSFGLRISSISLSLDFIGF